MQVGRSSEAGQGDRFFELVIKKKIKCFLKWIGPLDFIEELALIGAF